jgi:hypothetical protein
MRCDDAGVCLLACGALSGSFHAKKCGSALERYPADPMDGSKFCHFSLGEIQT